MNYQFYIKVDTYENKKVKLGQNHVISWNVRDLIAASSGWFIVNEGCVGKASSIIPILQKGITQLKYFSNDYSRYEAIHGLGTIENVLKFYQSLLRDCMRHPNFMLCGELCK